MNSAEVRPWEFSIIGKGSFPVIEYKEISTFVKMICYKALPFYLKCKPVYMFVK